MNRVETESFLKSFSLFFTSLSILTSILFYLNYTKEVQTLDESLFSQMRLCSYDLKCEQFKIDFISLKDEKLHTLYKDENGLTSYYPIPQSTQSIMLFNFSSKQYNKELDKLKTQELWKFASVIGIILLLSILFSFYALYPLRNALILTQEFIKDILHDFNTPLSSLRLNTSMLKKELGENEKINRIEQSVENVLALQEHLRSYLYNHTLQNEEFDLKTLVQNQVTILEKNYSQIRFNIDIDETSILTNKEAFIRIINNLLTNASKYNKYNGSIDIRYDKKTENLHITDTGKGIKNPDKIFDRFYKEQERGIGIGLHIVQKLCDELKIKVSVQSILNQGSTFTLNLSKLTLN